MEELVKQRIKEILSCFNVSQNKFANGDSAFQKRLSRQLNGGASIDFQTIASVLERFPEVSAEWLLRGEGTMLKSQHTVTYDINNEDECLGRAACPISPKAAALADADRILGKDEEASLGDPRLEQYIAALVRRQFQQELQKMMSRVG